MSFPPDLNSEKICNLNEIKPLNMFSRRHTTFGVNCGKSLSFDDQRKPISTNFKNSKFGSFLNFCVLIYDLLQKGYFA